MKSIARMLVMTTLSLLLVFVVAFARELGAREAREKIAAALAIDKPDAVRVKSISPGMGGQAIAVVTIDAAFRFVQDKEGNWSAADFRAGDRQWESLELIHTAVRKEKILRTTADLRTLATALEAFRRERGFYVSADTGAALVDNLAPRYLTTVLRLDAWSREFQYKGTEASYRLASLGPDGLPQTGDEIVIESGQLTKGAVE